MAACPLASDLMINSSTLTTAKQSREEPAQIHLVKPKLHNLNLTVYTLHFARRRDRRETHTKTQTHTRRELVRELQGARQGAAGSCRELVRELQGARQLQPRGQARRMIRSVLPPGKPPQRACPPRRPLSPCPAKVHAHWARPASTSPCHACQTNVPSTQTPLQLIRSHEGRWKRGKGERKKDGEMERRRRRETTEEKREIGRASCRERV